MAYYGYVTLPFRYRLLYSELIDIMQEPSGSVMCVQKSETRNKIGHRSRYFKVLMQLLLLFFGGGFLEFAPPPPTGAGFRYWIQQYWSSVSLCVGITARLVKRKLAPENRSRVGIRSQPYKKLSSHLE